MIKEHFKELKAEIIKVIPEAEIILKQREWEKLAVNYENRYENMVKNGKKEINSSCFLDVFACSLCKNKKAEGSRTQVNTIAREIRKAILYVNNENNKLKKDVEEIIRRLLSSMDTDPESGNSDYLNYYAEIMAFNFFTDCENCKVNDIEKKLDNNKTADFELRMSNGDTKLVEIFSIHKIDATKHESAETLSNFIERKIEKKYEDKTIKLNIQNLFILPVIHEIPGEEVADIPPTWEIMIDNPHAMPIMTIVKNSIDGKDEEIIMWYDKVREHVNK